MLKFECNISVNNKNKQVGHIQIKKVILFAITVSCLILTRLNAQTLKDIDGNIYLTVSIGKQVWIASNLKTTRLNDGKAIPLVTDDNKWAGLNTPAYCWYDNDIKNKDISGFLYNYYTVKTGKLCPKGWHVPTDPEWADLVYFLGDINTSGNKLKEAGLDHWKNYFSDATNDFDFSALPGGMRFYTGVFPLFGDSYAIWWTSTEYSKTEARNRGLHDSSSKVWRGFDKFGSGFSVRCIRD